MRQTRWLTIFFLWLAFGLRVWGLSFGLPYKFHPDEDKYVDTALAWHTTGQMELELINPPFFTYVLAAADGLWLALSPFTPTEAWLTGAYTFARFWSVAFSLLTVCVAYALAKRLHTHQAGLIALILLSGLFLPGREAHFAVNDSAVTFWVLLTLYFCTRLLQTDRGSSLEKFGRGLGDASGDKNKEKNPQISPSPPKMVGKSFSGYLYMAVGLAAGLAASAKLTGGLVLISVLLTFGLLKKRNYGLMALSLGLTLLAFGLVSAHIFGRWPEFVATIASHLAFGAEGYKGLRMSPGNGWLFYGYVLSWGVGWLLLAVIGFSLVKNLARPTRPILVLIAFPLALFIYMGAQKIVFARFLLPAVPPLVILAALTLVDFSQRWAGWRRHPKLVWVAVLGLLLWQPLLNLIQFDYLLTQPDTRQQATAWFTGQFTPGTVVARESYSILPNTVFLDKAWPYDTDSLGGNRQLKSEADYYLNQDSDLIAVSNFTSGRVRDEAAAESLRQAQLAQLAQKAVLLKEFNPYQPGYSGWFYLDELYGPAGETLQRRYPGPLIRVYQLKP